MAAFVAKQMVGNKLNAVKGKCFRGTFSLFGAVAMLPFCNDNDLSINSLLAIPIADVCLTYYANIYIRPLS